MAGSETRGLFRKKQKAGRERKAAEDLTWFVRRAVPVDLRGRPRFFKGEVQRTTGTSDYREAIRIRASIWKAWSDLFEVERLAMEAEARGLTAPANSSELIACIERWRSEACLLWNAEPTMPWHDALPPSPREAGGLGAYLRSLPKAPVAVQLTALSGPRRARMPDDVRSAAEDFFSRHPNMSRDLAMPPTVAMLIGNLQKAVRDREAWRDVPNFSAEMSACLSAEAVVAPPGLIAECRQPYAKAWLEVERCREAARMRAAGLLLLGQSGPEAAAVAVRRANAYVAEEGDKSIQNLIDAYRADRTARSGGESTERKYSHVFQALTEVLDGATPIRAITREHAMALRDFFRRLPAHASKRYPNLTLREAIEQGAEDEAPLLAPNSVNTYVGNLSAMLNWARDQGWVDRNVAERLADKGLPSVRRRGFTSAELEVLFEALAVDARAAPWRFWIPALALTTGARLNEICQLRTDDLRYEGGVPYFAITRFDPGGRRDREKRLKTSHSERNMPIHPDVRALGFVEFVASVGADTIFDLPVGPGGTRSHDVSKWFGRLCDRVGLSAPSLCFHSLRHGFRDACDVGGVEEAQALAIGGWAQKGEGNRYGRRDAVLVMEMALAKVTFGDFDLKRFRPAWAR